MPPSQTYASVDELSDTVLAWLDQRQGSALRGRSATWSSRQLRDGFRANLARALDSAVTISNQVVLIEQLTAIFGTAAQAPTSAAPTTWSVVPYDGPRPATFPAMRTDIAQLLGRSRLKSPPGQSPDQIATLIVESLSDALSADAGRVRDEAAPRRPSPEQMLHFYMEYDRAARKYNVRTFLTFLGLVIATASIYSVAEPLSVINPATAVFMILGYAVLIMTVIAHEISGTRGHERNS